MKKKILLMIPLLFLFGCSSCVLKDRCEHTNWFDYGQQLARKGQRPASDQFVLECKKVEAEISESQLHNGFREGVDKYCKPDAAFETGKNGEKLVLDLCDTSVHWSLTKRHGEGVQLFCVPSNGYPFGSSGKVYNGICPKNLEPAFKKEYTRGRKKYLEQSIISLEQSNQSLNNQITQKTVELSYTTAQMSGLQRPYQIQKYVNGIAKTETVDPDQWKRNELERNMNSIRTEIKNMQDTQNLNNETIRQQRLELGTLE